MARILVIEDNPTNLELMVYLLQSFGHTPLAATRGEEGIGMALRERPDLIICDVQMPAMDGYEVARRLKRHPILCATPVVAVTALAMVGDRDKVLGAGFNGYIAKPIDPETFVGQAEAFLPADYRTAAQPQPHASTPARAARPAARATILVVDNSPVNLSLMHSMLEPLGYTIISAGGVSEGLALAQQTPPDLILSDLHMPGQTGYDFIKAVKADPALRHIPFIFISSTVWREKDRTDGLALGARKFILRPIEPEQLLKELEECLSK